MAAYILIRFTNLDKLVPAVREIEACRSIVRWNAVDGHVNAIIKLASSSDSVPDEIKKLNGITDLIAYDVAEECQTVKEFSPSNSYVYLFVETESFKKIQIKIRLLEMENVFSCEETFGGCDLIVLIEGENFQQIDYIVREKIQSIDGILRIKIDKIIDLKQI